VANLSAWNVRQWPSRAIPSKPRQALFLRQPFNASESRRIRWVGPGRTYSSCRIGLLLGLSPQPPPHSFRSLLRHSFLSMAPSVIDNTLGAVFIGFAIACMVYGLLLSQIFHYFRNYPGDKLLYKFIVSTLFITRLHQLPLILTAFPLGCVTWVSPSNEFDVWSLFSASIVRILETTDQCFIGHLVYFYAISNYLNPLVLARGATTWYSTVYSSYTRTLSHSICPAGL
jgi:hypothetical protein